MTMPAGELWLADIPFSAGQTTKVRPVLVLWLDGADVVVAAITTALPRSIYDVALQDWAASGLRKPSTVRLARLDCLESKLLIARLGTVAPQDGDLIKQTWTQQVKPQF